MEHLDLIRIGLTQSLDIFREFDLRRFYRSLKLLNESGISNREIARVVRHGEHSVREWKRGMIPTDKTVIIVVNRWAQGIEASQSLNTDFPKRPKRFGRVINRHPNRESYGQRSKK